MGAVDHLSTFALSGFCPQELVTTWTCCAVPFDKYVTYGASFCAKFVVRAAEFVAMEFEFWTEPLTGHRFRILFDGICH